MPTRNRSRPTPQTIDAGRGPTTRTRGSRLHARIALFATAVSLAFGVRLAVAQERQPAPEEPAPTDDSQPAATANDERARQLYADGDRRYAEGRYTEAIANFAKAYELSQRPLLLFNLANTYERMGEYAKAAEHLRRYLDAEGAENVDTVRQRLGQLERKAIAAQREREELAALRAKSPCPDPVLCESEQAQGPSDRGSYILFGTGGVALVSAVVFGFMARDAHGDVDGLCTSTDGTRLCPAEAGSAIDREKRFALFSDLSAGLGLISVATGTYLLLKHRRARAREKRLDRNARIEPRVIPSGMGVSVVGRF